MRQEARDKYNNPINVTEVLEKKLARSLKGDKFPEPELLDVALLY